MACCNGLANALRGGEYDEPLNRLYPENLPRARERAAQLVEDFRRVFAPGDETQVTLFSGPGRTEIGGNHTDHQHGRVLCGSVNLDMLACAALNGRDEIRICSQGYPPVTVELDGLEMRAEELGTSAALVRGVAAGLAQKGFSLSGFDACIVSDVLSGSGLSSSAAYEVLVGTVLNHFCCGDKLGAVDIAKVGQFAENKYFGKPCGLLDQMGAAVGGAVAIDFADPGNPVVEANKYDFDAGPCALCIVDTGSCHADLTDDYAQIPADMGAVAACFGKTVLRDVPVEDFYAALPRLREQVGDRAVLRAMHFFDEDVRAEQEAQALTAGDFDGFLALVNESGRSSENLLQNICPAGAPKAQSVSMALAVGKRVLGGRGAIRVHGGGFAGTVQAFVPREMLEEFKAEMERVFGVGACHVLRIRPQGGCVVLE